MNFLELLEYPVVLKACPACFGVYARRDFPQKQKYCRDCHARNCQEWYRQNRTRHAQNVGRWKAENPDKVAKHGRTRQARLQNAPGGRYTPRREDYKARKALYGGRCAYCKVAKATTYDHAVPVSRGGTNFAANIYPCCEPCNVAKGSKVLFFEWEPPVRLF